MAAVNLLPVPNPGNDSNLRTIWENFKKIRNHFPFFNVRDYGAVGDGTTVDTTAIQAAYDAAKANISVGAGTGGAVVYFPHGRYLSGALVFDSPFVSIQGEGPTASEILSYGSGTSLIKFYGGSGVGSPTNFNCFFRDIKILWNAGTWTQMLHLYNCSEIDIDCVWVDGSTASSSYAVVLESALTVNITKCIIRGAIYDAVRAMKINPGVSDGNAYPNAITISQSAIKRGNRWGIHYSDGEGFLVSACDMSANGDTNDVNHGAIYIDDAGREVGAGLCAIIENSRFEATGGVHVKVGKHAFSPGGTLIRGCAAGGAVYGVYCSVTSPDTAKVIVLDSGFVGSSTKDYYIGGDATAVILRSSGISATLSANSIAIPTPQDSSQSQINAGWLAYTPNAITNNSSSPNVSQYSDKVVLGNTVATTINKFLGCKDGNLIALYASTSNSTLKHRATGTGIADEIDCPGNADYHMAAGDTLFFVRISGHWYPVSMPQDLRIGTSPAFAGNTGDFGVIGLLGCTGVFSAPRANINSATDNSSYGINVKDLQIAAYGTQPLIRSYGVGNPGAANYESVNLYHSGTQALIQVAAAGTGTYRDLVLSNNGDALKVDSSQNVTALSQFTSAGAVTGQNSIKSTHTTAGIGYGTGAGGAVAQATSKSTGVTLSRASGQITMDAAALAADTTVTFTLTNTAIAATDILVLNHVSGGTAGAYTLNAQCAAGSASINVRNVTAGSLSEAIVIGYVLIKGVSA